MKWIDINQEQPDSTLAHRELLASDSSGDTHLIYLQDPIKFKTIFEAMMCISCEEDKYGNGDGGCYLDRNKATIKYWLVVPLVPEEPK
jgi:hypothetical protein